MSAATTDLSMCQGVFDRLTDESPVEAVIDTYGLVQDLKRAAKELEDKIWDEIERRVKARGSPIQYGDVLWIIKTQRKEKCKSVPKCIEAVLTAAGGDFAALDECLSSNAFKPGATRKLLGDKFEEVFDVIVEQVLEQGKLKPVKKLENINTAFLK